MYYVYECAELQKSRRNISQWSLRAIRVQRPEEVAMSSQDEGMRMERQRKGNHGTGEQGKKPKLTYPITQERRGK
jgi:hypothetical protein